MRLFGGAAGQVLWDAEPQATTESVIRLLQTRFGNELQAERFKAELRTRRRKPGETLQQLYQEICRLVALAYPQTEQALASHVAKEAFLSAVDDPSLQLKVMEREPKTIEDALNIASKLEAYERSLSGAGRHTDHEEEGGNRRKPKRVYSVNSEQTDSDVTTLAKQMAELQSSVTNIAKRMDSMNAELRYSDAYQPPSAAVFTPQIRTMAESDTKSNVESNLIPNQNLIPKNTQHTRTRPGQRGERGYANYRRPDRTTDPCRICGIVGHWAAECERNKEGAAKPVILSVSYVGKHPSEVYVQAKFNGKPICCLLDSGCDRSLVGRSIARGLPLRPTGLKLHAANGAQLPLDGETEMTITIEGRPRHVNVVVTASISELILGSDWLSEHRCVWDFGSSKLLYSFAQCGDIFAMIKR